MSKHRQTLYLKWQGLKILRKSVKFEFYIHKKKSCVRLIWTETKFTQQLLVEIVEILNVIKVYFIVLREKRGMCMVSLFDVIHCIHLIWTMHKNLQMSLVTMECYCWANPICGSLSGLRNAFQDEMIQGEDKEVVLITLKRPLIYIQPMAVDKAILVWLNYKNAYEYWNEQRSNLNKEVLTATQQVWIRLMCMQICLE